MDNNYSIGTEANIQAHFIAVMDDNYLKYSSTFLDKTLITAFGFN